MLDYVQERHCRSFLRLPPISFPVVGCRDDSLLGNRSKVSLTFSVFDVSRTGCGNIPLSLLKDFLNYEVFKYKPFLCSCLQSDIDCITYRMERALNVIFSMRCHVVSEMYDLSLPQETIVLDTERGICTNKAAVNAVLNPNNHVYEICKLVSKSKPISIRKESYNNERDYYCSPCRAIGYVESNKFTGLRCSPKTK